MKKRAGVLILMLLLLGLGTTAISVAARKAASDKGATKKLSAALPSGSTAFGSARCAKKTHATGGGFAVDNGYDPSVTPATGTNSRPQNLFPSGNRTWSSSISSTLNTSPTNTTSYVRCEKNRFSRNAGTISGSFTLSPLTASTIKLVCPTSTRVVSGGYSVSPSFDATAQAGTTADQLWVTQNRRTKTREWRVTAAYRSGSPATVKGYEVCERKKVSRRTKTAAISEHSRLVPFSDKTRASSTARCSKNQHAVSGGFLLSPELQPRETGALPFAFVDASMPVGSNAWKSRLFAPIQTTTPGLALTTYVYCRSNKVKR